jgi:hypothetical protein
MNCVELQQSLAEVEEKYGSAAEQSSHLRTCPECAALVEELNLIVGTATQLQASDEPSPRVWNSIEATLRNEGLIRPQLPARRSAAHSFAARWGAARWLVPVAALLLLAIGLQQRGGLLLNRPAQEAVVIPQSVPQLVPLLDTASGLNDEDLIQEVADNPPAMRSQYEEYLKRVNESIQDAQAAVNESPNDPDARHLLMDAYQQKSMLFEMAMDQPQR